MRHAHSDPHMAVSLRTRIGLLLGAILTIGLLAASPAAAFEQVGTFAGSATPVKEEKFSEDVQLGSVNGMAVNYTGAGGVPAGTIYAATFREGSTTRVARYNPDGSFSEAWSVLTEAGEEINESEGKPPYERCGPDGEVITPEEGEPTYAKCPTVPKGGSRSVDVDVDQATGNVYVYPAIGSPPPGTKLITEYTPDGSEVITRFGERAGEEPTEASPGKIHRGATGGGQIAVNAAGEVYVFDVNDPDNFYHRLMVFKPKTPGDYTEYEYAGQSKDIAAGFIFTTKYPGMPVVDAAGKVYVAGEDFVQELDPAHPADPPLCEFKVKKGGITSMTVNPKTGEVFFYVYKDQRVHRLSPCEEGEFTEVESFVRTPERAHIYALTFDPDRTFEVGRPSGVLYGGAPGPTPGFGTGGPGEPGQSSLGYVFAPGNESPPEVVAEAVSMVTQTSARLEGEVNPKGIPSRYSFQYISDTAYQANEPADRFAGAGEAPVGGGPIEGAKTLPVGDAVGGLSPDTLYRYRLVAVSHCRPAKPAEECVSTGAEKTFRTYPLGGPGLPDNRAYELVSPAEKNGGQVFPADPGPSSCLPAGAECKPGSTFNHFPMQSAPSGDAIVYEGNPFSFEVGAVIENEYIARRTAAGWQSTNLTPARLQSKAVGGFLGFKADLSEGVLAQDGFPLTAEGPQGFGNLYRQPSADPATLDRLLSQPPPNRLPNSTSDGLRLSFAGASADFSRIFFSANDALSEETPSAPAALDGGLNRRNLYEWSGGALRLVNVFPGNTTTAPGAVFGSGVLLKGGSPGTSDEATANSISQDGRRVFWSDEAGQAYVREGGEVTRELTDHAGKFLTASRDGSKVLLSDGCLYDLAAEACLDLTQGKGGFEGIAGQSDDLSHIYFVDSAVLTGEEENGHGDKAQAGKHNLYAWAGGAPTFIATLLPADNAFTATGWDWAYSPLRRTAEASPGGGWLAFSSKARLTGFDNTGPCIVPSGTENYKPGPCAEIFLYQASTGELRCASCTPSGAAPAGDSVLRQLAGGNAALPQPHYLTDSGRLFFDSSDSLSPADTNGRVEDVYEFEPGGVGSCERAAGCVSLISAGRSGVDSNFLAADPSGKNVFFTTRDKLVGTDKDELIDLYDAREGGGFPTQGAPAECQGEACLPAVSPPENPTPGSTSFRGDGNVGEKKHKKKKHRHKRHAHKQRKAHRNHGGSK